MLRVPGLLGAAIGLLAALGLGGCAALRPAPPEVSLQSVRVVELGLSEQRFAMILRVRNPNARDYVVTGIAYEAELAGRPFARGATNQRTVLAAYGETLVEVPATARLNHLLGGILGGLDALFGKDSRGEFDYRVSGTVEIEGVGRIPFDRKGKVRLGPQEKLPLPENGRS